MSNDDALRYEAMDMHNSGVSVKMISEELGVAYDTVRKWLVAFGIEMGPPGPKRLESIWTDDMWEGFVRDYYGGMAVRDVMEKYGIGTTSLFYQILHRNGMKPRQVSNDATQARKMMLDHAIKLYNETDIPIYKICDEAGISPPTLNNEIHRRGITLRSKRPGYRPGYKSGG